MTYKNLIYFILYFLLSPKLFAQQTIVWQSSESVKNINQLITYYEDLSGKLEFENILSDSLQTKFKTSEGRAFNSPTSDNTYWIKFQIENQSSEQLILNIDQAIIGDVSFFYVDSMGKWIEEENLKSSEWTDKLVNHHLNNFIIPDKAKSFYLKIESRTTPIELRLMNVDRFDRLVIKNNIIFSCLMGFMVFVILYNLFLFYTIRRKEYFIYCLLIFGYLMFSITGSGFIHYFIKLNDIWTWYQWVPFLVQPLSMYYTLVFLEIKKYPWVYKLGLALLFYFISYIIWHIFCSRVQVALLSQLHAIIGMSMMIFFGFYVGKKGNKLGYYFAFGYIMMIIFGIIDISSINIGSPPRFFDINYMVIGFLFEVIILSYLLTKRIEWENKDILRSKEEAQLRLVETTLENERIVKNQNIILEELVSQRTSELSKSIDDLKSTQAQLIQSEKMASLGELTAGIAHEIQNPLNFVNNFSELSVDLTKELKEEVEKLEIPDKDKEYVTEIIGDLCQNQEKINEHGMRASSIVKGMLDHSRKHTGEKRPTNINDLCDEFLKLSYHGLRAKDKSFNASMVTHFDVNLPKIELIPQDIGRVILNLINNAFYAVNEQSKKGESGYQPTITISTELIASDFVQITIQDNGPGIPEEIKDKIFQPFFTTKPTGKGTGLGLSLSYDIVKAHGGQLRLGVKDGIGTIFCIILPAKM